MNELVITLPYPPSINHYWRHTARKIKGKLLSLVYISAEGKAFRDEIIKIFQARRFEGFPSQNLFVEIYVYPPNRRRRDIDNSIKTLLDSLQHAGVYTDDYQVTKLYVERCGITPKGAVRVRITAIVANDKVWPEKLVLGC